MSQNKISFALGSSDVGTASTSTAGMSNMERLLAAAKTKLPVKAKPSAATLFADEDDDSAPQTPSTLLAGPFKPRPQPRAAASSMSRAEKRAQAEALRVDATVFDYDGVYDGMKAAERQVEQAKKLEDAERKPKYIENFLASAQTRRLDKLRAEEKMLQLEREKEGDEFVDKEKFVTEAYKKQMEEVRKAEEEEKQREDALRKSKKGPGLTSFYKDMLDGDAKKHAAAVAAANGSTDSGPSLAIRPPAATDNFEDEAEYDPFLAREAKEDRSKQAGTSTLSDTTGKDVDINDDGEVVDKRSLLKAGLNIMKKPSSALPNSLLTGQRSGNTLEGPYKSRAVGTAASYQERIERERKRLADQLAQEQERKRLAEEAREKEEAEAARRRREGDGGDAERKRAEAKERAAERKRAKEGEKDGSRKKPKVDGE